MSEYYTVDTLINELTKLKAKGLGNRVVVISCDEEGNDYRGLLNQGFLISKKEIEDYLGEYDDKCGYYEGAYHCYVKPEKIVVL